MDADRWQRKRQRFERRMERWDRHAKRMGYRSYGPGKHLFSGLLAGLLLSIPSWAGSPALVAPVSEV